MVATSALRALGGVMKIDKDLLVGISGLFCCFAIIVSCFIAIFK